MPACEKNLFFPMSCSTNQLNKQKMSTAANRIRCVLQRVHSAELLIDNKEEWKQIGFGVVVYVCFLKDCTSVEVEKAGK